MHEPAPDTRAQLRALREQRQRQQRRPRTTLWVSLAVLGLLLFVAAWVGIRGMLAKDALESAVPEASALAQHIASGDQAAAERAYKTLSDNASTAASLTSDPIWRGVEYIPYLGGNLTAVRDAAAIVDDVTHDGIAPLVKLTQTVTIDDFTPVNGAIQLQPLVEAQPALAAADAAMTDASARARAIDTDSVLEFVASAITRLSDTVTDAAAIIDAADRAAALLPPMMGAEGERNYVLLFQNPAELRSAGGIPGALAQLTATDGALALTEQASSADFPRAPEPVLELPLETRGLYGDITGQYIQNVTLTPEFPLSGALAAEMWRQQFGVQVDGVISVDPVTLSYLLNATGPVTLPTGDELTSDNAVQLLLSDVYARYPDPREQDAFFASAAAAVFDTIAEGTLQPAPLLDALTRAGEERRLLVWSAHPDEQARLAETTLAGELPTSDDTATRFGIYFNDATGSKMGTYLQTEIKAGQVTCRNDRRPNLGVEITLTNTAPADAATSLPRYVTGGGAFGVEPGNIRILTAVYGPVESQNLGITGADGADIAHQATSNNGYPVSSVQLELRPGESQTIRADFLGLDPAEREIIIERTPEINMSEVTPLAMTCEIP